uniref:U3 small nucleolar RNA-associated protein 14 A n=1 Tax=Mesocestoides corti TaxID=53468 RepID=A0A5K3FQ12_MESCO
MYVNMYLQQLCVCIASVGFLAASCTFLIQTRIYMKLLILLTRIMQEEYLSTCYVQIQKESNFDKERDEQIKLVRKMSMKVADQMKHRLREVALLRKAKLQKRIKSKSYHRRAKRRNMKEFEKDIALLRQNNPQAFAERLLEAERVRAKERASLRHKTGGKFAKMQRLRAKYDKESRDAVAQMHDQAHHLTKRRQNCDTDSESALSEVDLSSSESEDDDAESNADDVEMDERVEEESLPRLSDWWAKVENQPRESNTAAKDNSVGGPENATPTTTTLLSTQTSDELLQKVSDTQATGESGIGGFDPSDENFSALQEAVGDVGSVEPAMAGFEQEKKAVEDEEAPKDLDPFLPGWNRWSGPGTEAIDEQLRKKHLIKAPRVKRKDRGRTKVIIRERVNTELKKHLVKRIPFPYARPEQFEEAMAQPISREWTTEAAHLQLTKPKVILKAGHVIKPINRDVALLREKDALRLITGSKKV